MKAYRIGKIQTPLFTLPVRLLPVIQKPPSTIKLFHTTDKAEIGLRYYSKKTGKHVAKNEIIRAISTANGLQSIKSSSSKIDKSTFPIEGFIDPRQLDWRLLGKAYYVAPLHPDSWYAALHQSLYDQKTTALLRFSTQSSKSSHAILTSNPDSLLLFQLRTQPDLTTPPQNSFGVSTTSQLNQIKQLIDNSPKSSLPIRLSA